MLAAHVKLILHPTEFNTSVQLEQQAVLIAFCSMTQLGSHTVVERLALASTRKPQGQLGLSTRGLLDLDMWGFLHCTFFLKSYTSWLDEQVMTARLTNMWVTLHCKNDRD